MEVYNFYLVFFLNFDFGSFGMEVYSASVIYVATYILFHWNGSVYWKIDTVSNKVSK